MSSLSEHVSLTITESNVSVTRLGFGTPLILSVNAGFAERIRYYTELTGLTDDGFVSTSPEYLAARAIMSQNPSPERFAIGRAVGKPTQAYTIGITSAAAGSTYGLNVLGTGVTATECRYTALANQTFTAANATETFTTVAHGMSTGDGPFRVSNSGGALPAGLAVDTDYWVISLTADTYQLATSKADALALTELLITTDGTGTQTLLRANNDTIVAQLVQSLNAVVGKNYTAVHTPGAGETDTIVVTGTAAGDWFSLEITNVTLMSGAQTHAEPGTTLAADLAAIAVENTDWYALVTLYNSEAYVKAAAAWIETEKKIYIADVAQSETVTLAAAGTGSSDLADDLKVLAYTRTATAYHPSPGAMLGAAWLGTRLPFDPGAETWKFARPAGVSAVSLTATHRVNLRAKKANTLQTVAGVNIMWEGTTVDGDFIDTTRGLDWLEDDMTKAVFGAMAGALKVPYTNAGLAFIENQIRGSLSRAISRGILSPDLADEPIITMPKIANISANDKGIRLLPDVKWSARLAGAVHRVQINGTVSV